MRKKGGGALKLDASTCIIMLPRNSLLNSLLNCVIRSLTSQAGTETVSSAGCFPGDKTAASSGCVYQCFIFIQKKPKNRYNTFPSLRPAAKKKTPTDLQCYK